MGCFLIFNDGLIANNINFCNENCPYPKAGKKRSKAKTDKVKPEKRHDLTDAPKSDRLYNRTQEINTLKQWILEEKIPDRHCYRVIGYRQNCPGSGTGDTN
jgi:hypothetical protein